LEAEPILDYFEAVQEGRLRVKDAIDLLEGVAGPCYPMLFLKMGTEAWTPVGPEMFHKLIPGKNSTAALVVCDADGNSKAMSAWLPTEEAAGISMTLESKGVPEFSGDVRLPI